MRYDVREVVLHPVIIINRISAIAFHHWLWEFNCVSRSVSGIVLVDLLKKFIEKVIENRYLISRECIFNKHTVKKFYIICEF